MVDVCQAITDRAGRELGCTTERTVESDDAACLTEVNYPCFVCSAATGSPVARCSDAD